MAYDSSLQLLKDLPNEYNLDQTKLRDLLPWLHTELRHVGEWGVMICGAERDLTIYFVSASIHKLQPDWVWYGKVWWRILLINDFLCQ